jgi:predicted DsbA family dithiol-disulfide isomerase
MHMRLDIISDVVCPWCLIGYKRLERAMQELAGEMSFEIEWHPFELNPDMPPEGENSGEHIMRKYGLDREQMQENRERIAGIARSLGVDFNTADGRRIYNTFDAHRVLHWAREQGKQMTFKLALFHEYFVEGHNPSDPGVLQRVAESLGLDAGEATAIIGSDRYADAVRAEEEQFISAGIRAVPAFIINQKYLISGGQEPATFVSAFRKIAAE